MRVLLTVVATIVLILISALGASFLGLFVHALFYSGFLEDPLTWLVIAIAAAYCTEPRVERRRREVATA